MRRPRNFNALLFLIIGAVALAAAYYGYLSPGSFETAARTAVSSLSIIFGLSAAISSLVHINGNASLRVSSDPATSARIDEKLTSDDDRTLCRLRLLHLVTLVSIMFGLVYLVAVNDAPCAIFTKLITGAFVFGTSVALMSTLFLPSLLIAMVKRNAYVRSKSSDT